MEKKDPTRKVYIKDTPFEVPYCTEQKNAGSNAWVGPAVTAAPDNHDRRDGPGRRKRRSKKRPCLIRLVGLRKRTGRTKYEKTAPGRHVCRPALFFQLCVKYRVRFLREIGDRRSAARSAGRFLPRRPM